MGGWGQAPSQPSNFVSILHLRERWIKENERIQEVKEEQKQPEQQVRQQNDQKTEDVKPVVLKPRIRNSSRRNRGGKFPTDCPAVPASNPRNVSKTCKKTEDEGEPLPAVSPIESDEKKKKSKKKGRKKKPRAQDEEVDRTARTAEGILKEEMRETECEAGEQKEKKDVRAKRIDEKKGMESRCGSETGYKHEMKEVENELRRISVKFEIKRWRNNGVYRGSSQGYRNFRGHRHLDRWAPQKQGDVGMIWVRKDELRKAA